MGLFRIREVCQETLGKECRKFSWNYAEFISAESENKVITDKETIESFDKTRWLLSYLFKCPLSDIDCLSLNDFYGLLKTLSDMNAKEKKIRKISETRPATKKELEFVNKYIAMTKQREQTNGYI